MSLHKFKWMFVSKEEIVDVVPDFSNSCPWWLIKKHCALTNQAKLYYPDTNMIGFMQIHALVQINFATQRVHRHRHRHRPHLSKK